LRTRVATEKVTPSPICGSGRKVMRARRCSATDR
jgi:hypothetical protein